MVFHIEVGHFAIAGETRSNHLLAMNCRLIVWGDINALLFSLQKRIKEFMMDYQPLFQVVHILQSITLVLTFLALGDFSNCKLTNFTFSPMEV